MKYRYLINSLLFLVLVGLVAAIYYVYQDIQNSTEVGQNEDSSIAQDDSDTMTPEESLDAISGRLIYALSPTPDRVTQLHAMDVETGEQELLVPEDGTVKFSPELSPDGRYVAYTAAPIDMDTDFLFPHSGVLQLYIYDTRTGESRKVSSTTQSFLNKKPRWSPDGRYILFHGYSREAYENNDSIREPDNWIIYRYDSRTGTVEEVAEGFEQVWAADGNAFFYIKNDGLHIMDTRYFDDELLIGIVGDNPDPTANASMSLGISPDGSKLAWASPPTNELVIYDVVSWYPERNSIRRTHRFDTGVAEIYNPTFSPDNKYLSVQETEFPIERLKGKPDPNNQLSIPELNLSDPRITIYELQEFKAKRMLDLDGYDFYGTTLMQWVE